MRQRKYKSKKDALLKKAREAMLTATQIYNNPLVQFKSETFITLSVIAWTYLLHAYYHNKGVDYCYYKTNGKKKVYALTKHGAIKHWELEECLKCSQSPIDDATKANLMFLIGIRHEIEHQMTNCIDEFIGAKLQACVLNFNYYIKTLFGTRFALDKELALSLSIDEIDPTVAKTKLKGMEDNVQKFVSEFESSLDSSISSDKHYSYKILYMPISVNHEGQADKIIEFAKLSPDQETRVGDLVIIKDREKPKYKPKQIVEIMKREGYRDFTINKHTKFWQGKRDNGDDLSKYKVKLSDGAWYWYENWIELVRAYCAENLTKLLLYEVGGNNELQFHKGTI